MEIHEFGRKQEFFAQEIATKYTTRGGKQFFLQPLFTVKVYRKLHHYSCHDSDDNTIGYIAVTNSHEGKLGASSVCFANKEKLEIFGCVPPGTYMSYNH